MTIIIGSLADPHVAAVAELLQDGVHIVDAESLGEARFTVTEDGCVLGGVKVGGRGWLRRLAPPEWSDELRRADHNSAVKTAILGSLATILRDERIDWLSSLDAVAGAESKPRQYRLAASQGAPVPEWMVTTNPQDLGDRSWVAKPLGPGHFFGQDGTPRVVPTTMLDPANLGKVAGAPFLFQEPVDARLHARVVTVEDDSFSAVLRVTEDTPLDWRQQVGAHHSFKAEEVPDSVRMWAIQLAAACGVRYSAQDWILDKQDRWFFVDLNPSGQWLFLPDVVARQVTRAIADWLGHRR